MDRATAAAVIVWLDDDGNRVVHTRVRGGGRSVRAGVTDQGVPTAPPGVRSISVTCATCGSNAATVMFVLGNEGHPADGSTALADLGIYSEGSARGRFIVEAFGKKVWFIEDARQTASLLDVFQRKDWLALYRNDPEWMPTYCPTCRANYCPAHWTQMVEFDDGFYDCTRGSCPQGHRRVLDD